MPIDYKKYPINWKSEIRPRIIKRSTGHCEQCGVKNHENIIRGIWQGIDAYQDIDGNIYNANNSIKFSEDYVGEIHPTNKCITIVLTVAHLNHNINDNRDENLRALCQRCHNRHDAEHRKQTRSKNRGVIDLFNNKGNENA